MRPDDPVARELAAYEHLQRNSSGTQARERHDLPGPRPGEARRAPQPFADGTLPKGIRLHSSLDGEELYLSRTRETYMIQAAVVLAIVTVGVFVAGIMGGLRELSFLVFVLAFGGAFGLQWAHKKFRKAPPQVVQLSHRGVVVDGTLVNWDDVRAVRRLHTGRGGAVVVNTEDDGVILGGELRPSGVDFLEERIATHRALVQGGTMDEEGREALEQLRRR